ncbi:hypothetical protein GCM10027290_19520 [Micromonospora sonneratiae]
MSGGASATATAGPTGPDRAVGTAVADWAGTTIAPITARATPAGIALRLIWVSLGVTEDGRGHQDRWPIREEWFPGVTSMPAKHRDILMQ